MMDREQVLEELKSALAHLNDVAQLSGSPLVSLTGDAESPSRGMHLRSILLDLIARMKPSGEVPETAPEWRQYLILHDRYVLRRPLWEIEHKLTIGERQVRREHSRGLAILAEMLRARLAMPEEQVTEPAATPQQAIERLTPVARVFSLAQLVEEVMAFLVVVRKLHESRVRADAIPDELTVCTDPGILRQLLTNLLMTLDGTNQINVEAAVLDQKVDVIVHANGPIDPNSEGIALCQLLAHSIGASLVLDAPGGNLVRFNLPAGARLRKVLVIDDELAAVELFQSYVIGLDYEVIGETNAEEAVALALEVQPDVIMLDVMMPAMDGWELLQRLRHTTPIRDVPVIVCSVLNEADMAAALGAAAFLKKPILRSQLVKTLGEVTAGTT